MSPVKYTWYIKWVFSCIPAVNAANGFENWSNEYFFYLVQSSKSSRKCFPKQHGQNHHWTACLFPTFVCTTPYSNMDATNQS